MKKESKIIWFTWHNYHKGKKIYSRLDRFYANRDFFNFDLTKGGDRVNMHPYTL